MKEYKFVRSSGGVTVHPYGEVKYSFLPFVKEMSEIYDRPVHSFFHHHHFVRVKFDYEVVDPRPDGLTPYGVELFSPLFFTDNWMEYLFLVVPFLTIRRVSESENFVVVRLYPTCINWILPFPLPPPALLVEMDPTTYEPRTLHWLGPFTAGVTSRYVEVERRRFSPSAGLILSRLLLTYILAGILKIPTSPLGVETEEIREEEDILWSWVIGVLGNDILREERVIALRLLWDVFERGLPRRRFEQEIPSPIPYNRIGEIVYNFKVSLSVASKHQIEIPSVKEGKITL
ncbi:MAG: hypothetical protein QW687_02550 [Candidatus Hadarchaeales archaeon]